MAKKQGKNKGKTSLSIKNDRCYDNNMYGTNSNQENGLNYLVEDRNRKSFVLLRWINLNLVLLFAKKTLSGKYFQIFSCFVF